MKYLLVLLYIWGCFVITEILFDKESKLFNPKSTLSESTKIVRVIGWPFYVETNVIFISAKELSK